MILSIGEILDIVLMTAFIGFIFKDSFHIKHQNHDVLDYYTKKRSSFWEGFFLAVMAAAPAIVLHEMAHKFLALSYGMSAIFHASYTWLLIGIVLKLMSFGLIFFVPGYVSISGIGTHLQYAMVALAGPSMHLLLWGLASLWLKLGKTSKKYLPVVVMTKKINLFLFFFNMLPIPPFDGFSFFSNVYMIFF